MTFLAVKRPLGTLGRVKSHSARSIVSFEILARIDPEKIIKKYDGTLQVPFLYKDIIKVSKNELIQQCLQEINTVSILREDYNYNIVSFDTEDEALIYFELMD